MTQTLKNFDLRDSRRTGVGKGVPFKTRAIFSTLLVCGAAVFPDVAYSASDIELLRQQLQAQRSLIEQQRMMLQTQQEQIDRQAQELERLGNRIGAMESDTAGGAPAAVGASETVRAKPAPEESSGAASAPTVGVIDMRDDVGDLNSEAVQAGSFPGSFRIPGTRDVSLAIGGFVKAVSVFDSDAEGMGADFLPATLGTRRADKEGAYSIDATLSRVHIDGRAPLPDGSVRGYIEYDLNNNNDGSLGVKMRHAYGSWTSPYGTLTAGHTWSTFMDTKILPEGLTEPTLSGAIFSRQAILRWLQPLNPQWFYVVALEDPSSNDYSSSLSGVTGQTSLPDGILGIEYNRSGVGHVRLNGLLRRLEVAGTVSDTKTAWGVSLTGHLDVGESDRINLGGVYGEGVGRYLLGIQSSSGAAVESGPGLELRENWGGIATYLHHWNEKFRSTAMAGYAESNSLAWQPASTFKSTIYGAVNLMWSPYPYITVGAEYAYGKLENHDGTDLDNRRLGIGVQFF